MNLEQYMNKLEEYGNPQIQVPNSLADDITKIMRKHGKESYSHYAYSFLIINAFLYKYTHYISLEHNMHISIGDIKEILKYSRENKKLNKVVKSNGGILVEEGLSHPTTDFPMFIQWGEEVGGVRDRIVINYSDGIEIYRELIYGENGLLDTPNYTIHIPDFMIDSGDSESTITNYEDTFTLTYKEFKYFIFNDKFSLRDFFLYCFIRGKSSREDSPKLSFERIRLGTGMSPTTSTKTTRKLQNEGVMTVSNNGRMSGDKKMHVNSYSFKRSFIKKMGYGKREFLVSKYGSL